MVSLRYLFSKHMWRKLPEELADLDDHHQWLLQYLDDRLGSFVTNGLSWQHLIPLISSMKRIYAGVCLYLYMFNPTWSCWEFLGSVVCCVLLFWKILGHSVFKYFFTPLFCLFYTQMNFHCIFKKCLFLPYIINEPSISLS